MISILTIPRSPAVLRRGFSLIEALATVAIIGVITFLALPNIVNLRRDAERNMAVARAEAFNLGVAAYVQSLGLTAAAADWAPLNADTRYGRIRPFLAFAPASLSEYLSSPYSLGVANYPISSTGTATFGKIPLYDSTTGTAAPLSY
jgi:prepilin-type N-terminal cleavage/methylation domain-containing protein